MVTARSLREVTARILWGPVWSELRKAMEEHASLRETQPPLARLFSRPSTQQSLADWHGARTSPVEDRLASTTLEHVMSVRRTDQQAGECVDLTKLQAQVEQVHRNTSPHLRVSLSPSISGYRLSDGKPVYLFRMRGVVLSLWELTDLPSS